MKRNHEWGDALRFWRRTAEVSPKSARALRVFGQALIDRNKFREAVAPLRKSVEIYPVYDFAWVDLGIAQMQSGEAAAAETSLKRALRFNDENAEAHLALGGALYGRWARRFGEAPFRARNRLETHAGGGALQFGDSVPQGGFEAAGDSAVRGGAQARAGPRRRTSQYGAGLVSGGRSRRRAKTRERGRQVRFAASHETDEGIWIHTALRPKRTPCFGPDGCPWWVEQTCFLLFTRYIC